MLLRVTNVSYNLYPRVAKNQKLNPVIIIHLSLYEGGLITIASNLKRIIKFPIGLSFVKHLIANVRLG